MVAVLQTCLKGKFEIKRTSEAVAMAKGRGGSLGHGRVAELV